MAKVLVIDDEFGIAELLQAALEDEGHRVATASNGKHSIQLAETQRPDVVFLDYMMPVMDGAAVLRHFGGSLQLQRVPVVMMSSITEASVAQRCSGYVHFLRKPFSIFTVLELVDKLAVRAG